jgi:carbonic anhydrase
MSLFRKILLFLLLVMSQTNCSHRPSWSYSGESAPYYWGEIDHAYSSCKEGSIQSPIDLKKELATPIVQPITFYYEDLAAEAYNDGTTIKLKFNPQDRVEINSKAFYLNQLHFHAKSEHSVNGLFYPVEMHIVHQADDGELLVLAFFIEIDDSRQDHYGFFKQLPKSGQHQMTNLIKLTKLAAFNGPHFYYLGSLTTPPCHERVHWVIFEKHLFMSGQQLSQFSALYPNNYRPIVPMKQHVLYYAP